MYPTQEVLEIAAKARRGAEVYAVKHGYSNTLACLCDSASVALAIMLRRAGFRCVVVGNDYHAFVRFGSYWIIDITSTQFGSINKIDISPVSSPTREGYHKIKPDYKPQYEWYTSLCRNTRKQTIRAILELSRGTQP